MLDSQTTKKSGTSELNGVKLIDFDLEAQTERRREEKKEKKTSSTATFCQKL